MGNYLQAITEVEPAFVKLAEQRKLVVWAEESEFAKQAVQRNEQLQGCVVETIQDAIKNVAAVGLTLNPAHGYAYLVPEKIKIGQNYHQVCQLRVSFKGLIKLANDSGVAKWVRADVVKENDTFTFNGAWEKPTHQMNPFGDRGKSIGVYCTIKTHDGEYLTEVAPWSEVEKARKAAKTDYVWSAWPDEMAKKFIIKRASKQWPKGADYEHLSQAIDVINEYEGSETEPKRVGVMAAMLEEGGLDADEAKVAEWVEYLDTEVFTIEGEGRNAKLECVVSEDKFSRILERLNQNNDVKIAVLDQMGSKVRSYIAAIEKGRAA